MKVRFFPISRALRDTYLIKIVQITDIQIKNIKQQSKDYRVYDDGIYLLIKPSSRNYNCFIINVQAYEKTVFKFKTYPHISLADVSSILYEYLVYEIKIYVINMGF